jgi:hypothetical protein
VLIGHQLTRRATDLGDDAANTRRFPLLPAEFSAAVPCRFRKKWQAVLRRERVVRMSLLERTTASRSSA